MALSLPFSANRAEAVVDSVSASRTQGMNRHSRNGFATAVHGRSRLQGISRAQTCMGAVQECLRAGAALCRERGEGIRMRVVCPGPAIPSRKKMPLRLD